MRKIQLVSILLALLAFGALTATSAMATTLLAEWLLNGVAIGADNLVEIDGELLLTDDLAILGTAAASVLCSGILDGDVEPASKDTITELLTLGGGETDLVALTSIELSLTCTAQEGCETNTTPLVYAVGLPWESELELLEQGTEKFLADYLKTKANSGLLGWEITNCLVLGSPHEDKCTTKEVGAQIKLVGATLIGSFGLAFTELAGLLNVNCEAGGIGQGLVEGEGTFLVATGELMASSEGFEG